MAVGRRTLGITAAVVVLVVLLAGTAVALKVADLPPGTTLSGVAVGGPDDAVALAADMATRLDGLPVRLSTDAGQVEMSAGALGAVLDQQAVERAARASTGVDAWLDRLIGGRVVTLPVRLHFSVGEAVDAAARLSRDPVDGAVVITAGGVEVTDAVVGEDVTATAVSEAFRVAAAALESTPYEEWPAVLDVDVEGVESPPTITQVAVDAAVARIEAMTATPVELQAQAVPEDAQTVDGEGVPTRETTSVTLPPEALLQLLAVEEGPADAIQRDRLRVVASDATPPPVLVSFLDRAAVPPDMAVTVEDRSPTPTRVPPEERVDGPGGPADQPAYGDVTAVSGRLVAEVVEPGLEPSLPDTVRSVVAAMDAGRATAEVRGEEVTEADPADLGIVAPVSTWTTFYEPGQGRVTNIHRIAEILDGTLVPPGGNLDINHAVGRRTVERGFVEGGAILDGEFITDVGGGVSQFATTFFNAMWFSGIDIITHTPHSFWFERYPAGREATIDYPGVNLELNNNTPHWILVDTAVTEDSVTVTFWSTPWFEVETVMGQREPTDDGFRITIARTSTAPDGAVDDDQFRVTYRVQ